MRRATRSGKALDALVRALKLRPHPEGGHYRETWRQKPIARGERGSGTAIYYLLRRGEESRWHRIDAVEIWHHYAGAPLALTIATGGRTRTVRLGPSIATGERPQAVAPKGVWQRARSLGDWTLVGCTVSPAFDFAGFELAPEGFAPGGRCRRRR